MEILTPNLEAAEAVEAVVITEEAGQTTAHPSVEQIPPTIPTQVTTAKIPILSVTG